eukprot:CAMPEP_0184694262 /NCGR_PEP_ID=MMETSP0313-20130426/2281_1 /TAXON_ID=2792 /ORGANISM="Porphyridium aerugineum, Strain SAG 1380-2" /LENGTH=56 /DNA_ID=CAMNT_0027152527 /DNA_START=33 /DNA_END=200 /DNA_ORIENTATION=+
MTQWRNDNVEPNMSEAWRLPESPNISYLPFQSANQPPQPPPPPPAAAIMTMNKAWS